MKKYYVSDIFTPTSIANINYVEREKLDSRILSSLRTKGKQIVLFGHSGVGKTTLLRKSLQKTYEKDIISHCMKGMKFEELVRDAFDRLDQYYLETTSKTKKSSIQSSLSANYLAIKSTIKASEETGDADNFKRVINAQITPQRLADFLGQAECCWVLEDFHKMDTSEKSRLSQIMKVFMDKSADYPDLKIIALGAVNTGREVVEYDNEMRNRVSEIEVTLMKNTELRAIISKGEKFLNISFPKSLKDEIVEFSNGLASVCHAICSYVCEEAGIFETLEGECIELDETFLKAGIKRYMNEESDTLKNKFDIALNKMIAKKRYVELVLRALLIYDNEGASEDQIYREILDEAPHYKKKTLSGLLSKLLMENSGGLLTFDVISKKYSFSMPLYKTYATAYFEVSEKQDIISSKSLKNKISKMAYDAIVQEQMNKYTTNIQ